MRSTSATKLKGRQSNINDPEYILFTKTFTTVEHLLQPTNEPLAPLVDAPRDALNSPKQETSPEYPEYPDFDPKSPEYRSFRPEKVRNRQELLKCEPARRAFVLVCAKNACLHPSALNEVLP